MKDTVNDAWVTFMLSRRKIASPKRWDQVVEAFADAGLSETYILKKSRRVASGPDGLPTFEIFKEGSINETLNDFFRANDMHMLL